MPARENKAGRAYRLLRAEIESGGFQPGETLPEAELVALTGTSRTPVREAIRRLASEGLVDLTPRRAPVVPRVSMRSIRELLEFRRLIEIEAVRLTAIRARSDPDASQSFVELSGQFAALPQGRGFTERHRELAEKFDEELARFTPNRYLARSIAEIRTQHSRLRALAQKDALRATESIEQHVSVCRAVAAGDDAAAVGGYSTHLDDLEQALISALLSVDGASSERIEL